MQKGALFLTVMVVAGVLACATRTGEPRAVALGAVSEADGETTCTLGQSIDIMVPDGGTQKSFSPAAPWTVNKKQSVTFTNQTPFNICLDIVGSSGTQRHFLSASGGSWNDACMLAQATYKVGVCFRTGTDCPKDCGDLNATQGGQGITETIKGELVVISSE